MKNLEENLLIHFSSVVDDLMNNLNLANRNEKEVQEIRSFLQEALSDRVNLFILEKLSSAGLDNYEKLISQSQVDFNKVAELIMSDIKDFRSLLRQDLADFAKEAVNNFVK
jgi:uncharacterized protein YpuA (DUF1002 family)